MTCTVEEIHEGDIGTVFRVTVEECLNGVSTILDVSDATTQEIRMKPPTGDAKTMTSGFTTDGTDGLVEYATIADDLDEVGNWKLQFHVVLPTGEWRSDIQKFKVYSNL